LIHGIEHATKVVVVVVNARSRCTRRHLRAEKVGERKLQTSAQLYNLQLPIWELGCDSLQGKCAGSRIGSNST
jgi:hypothetical protein